MDQGAQNGDRFKGGGLASALEGVTDAETHSVMLGEMELHGVLGWVALRRKVNG
jgi:hypothetical protein